METSFVDKLVRTKEILDIRVYDKIVVSFRNCEVKRGNLLFSETGCGNNVEEACADYYNKIFGERVVFNALDDKNRYEVKFL